MTNNLEQVKRRRARLSEKCCVRGKQTLAKGQPREWRVDRMGKAARPPCRFGAGGANCSSGKTFALYNLGFQRFPPCSPGLWSRAVSVRCCIRERLLVLYSWAFPRFGKSNRHLRIMAICWWGLQSRTHALWSLSKHHSMIVVLANSLKTAYNSFFLFLWFFLFLTAGSRTTVHEATTWPMIGCPLLWYICLDCLQDNDKEGTPPAQLLSPSGRPAQ